MTKEHAGVSTTFIASLQTIVNKESITLLSISYRKTSQMGNVLIFKFLLATKISENERKKSGDKPYTN